MPFEPLTPEEQKQFPEPCRSPEHDPPNMIVITRPMKWVCPACGHSVILRPSSARLVVEQPRSRKWRSIPAAPATESRAHAKKLLEELS